MPPPIATNTPFSTLGPTPIPKPQFEVAVKTLPSMPLVLAEWSVLHQNHVFFEVRVAGGAPVPAAYEFKLELNPTGTGFQFATNGGVCDWNWPPNIGAWNSGWMSPGRQMSMYAAWPPKKVVRDNLNKDGLGFSGGFRWSFGGILCPRAVFRMLRLLTSPHRGLVADLAGPPAAHRENLGALSPRQQVSRLSAVSRLPSPNSTRRSVFFARPR